MLQTNGICVVEEVDFDAIDERSARWFMDRIDLLNVAKVSQGHPEDETMALLLDTSIDSFKRWNTFFERAMKHHHMNHGHNHAMFYFKEMLDCMEKVFGEERTKIHARVPFFYQFSIYIA